MSTFYNIEDGVTELVDQIAKVLRIERNEVLAIAVALLAARMRIPVIECE